MKRIISLALASALSLCLAAPAFAHGDHGHGPDAKDFPMKAEVFQQRLDARLVKGRAHLEARIVEKKVDDAKAKEMRAHFEERWAKVKAAAVEAEKDGVVTLEEAQAVRKAGGGGHHHHDKDEPKN